jgi:hypothetical protein
VPYNGREDDETKIMIKIVLHGRIEDSGEKVK